MNVQSMGLAVQGGVTALNRETEARVRVANNGAIVDLIGDVTSQGETTIKNAYQEALQTQPERVFFNFAETEYINTSGIAVLISMVMAAEKDGRKIGLFGMSDHYRKVFTLVRLPLYADMYANENEAMNAL
jgi:anti-anti-sigma factor